MTLRNNKKVTTRPPNHDEEEMSDADFQEDELQASNHITEEHRVSIYPLMTKSGHRQPQYVPWSFCDMIGLAGRLPHLTEGANKWITALEENTAGVTLALGDIKALLMHVGGKHTTEEIFHAAQLPLVVQGNRADDLRFNSFRNRIWAELRKQYRRRWIPQGWRERH